MPKISEDIIRAVTDAAKIEEVVGDFVTLRKAGVNMTGLCPFHDDKNDGNFIVRPSTLTPGTTGRNTYKCFVCEKKGSAVKFLMEAENMTFPDAIRYLGKKYCIPVDDVPVNWTPPPPRPVPPPLPALEIPREWVSELIKRAPMATFTTWFYSLPWSVPQINRLHKTLWEYCVGGWKDHRVVFWQIDHEGIPRAAKLMKYMPDGHRYKEKKGEKNATGWLYNQPGHYDQNGNYIQGPRDICQPDKHTVLHPLFGAHLLKRYPQATVNVVESEKTALVMANFYGMPDRQLWLAVGGLQQLKLESMQPLIDQGRKVWLWPDKDGIDKWQEVADKLGSEQVQVYTKFFDTCWEPQDGDKADAADITIRIMNDPSFRPKEIPSGISDTSSGKSDKLSGKSDTLSGKPDGVTEEEWFEQLDIMKAIGDYEVMHPELANEPFFDAEEMADPQLHMWRETLRQRYNFNKRHKTNDRRTETT